MFRSSMLIAFAVAASFLGLNGHARAEENAQQKAPDIWCLDKRMTFRLYPTSMGFQADAISPKGHLVYSMGGLTCKFSEDDTMIFNCTPKWDRKGFVAMNGKATATLTPGGKLKESVKFKLGMQTGAAAGIDFAWTFESKNCTDLSVEDPLPPTLPTAPETKPSAPLDSSVPNPLDASKAVEVLNAKRLNSDGVGVTIEHPRFVLNGEEAFYAIPFPSWDPNPRMLDGICAYFHLGQLLSYTPNHYSDEDSEKTVVTLDREGHFAASFKGNRWIENITCRSSLKSGADAAVDEQEILDVPVDALPLLQPQEDSQ